MIMPISGLRVGLALVFLASLTLDYWTSSLRALEQPKEGSPAPVVREILELSFDFMSALGTESKELAGGVKFLVGTQARVEAGEGHSFTFQALQKGEVRLLVVTAEWLDSFAQPVSKTSTFQLVPHNLTHVTMGDLISLNTADGQLQAFKTQLALSVKHYRDDADL